MSSRVERGGPNRTRPGRDAVWLVAVALSGLLPAGLAGQDRGVALMSEVGARYGAVETLCADFAQRLEVPLLGDEATGAGRLCQGRPNLFAMRFTDPDGDAVVADGTAVWVYLPSSDPNQVIKTSPDRAAGGHDFHREFLVDTEERYEVSYQGSETVGGRAAHHVRLVPLEPAGYRFADLWIDEERLVLSRLRIEEESGSIRTVTLENVELGATVPEGWFRFTPPPGASVLVG